MGLFDVIKGLFGGAKKAADAMAGGNADGGAAEPNQYPAASGQHAASRDDDDDGSSHDASDSDNNDGESDDWGGWDPQNHEEFWYRLKAIEQAGMNGDDAAVDAKCREYGLRDWAHMQRVRDTFNRHFGHSHEFMQVAFNVQTRRGREQMEAAGAANKAIFEPIEGITLEVFAKTQAQAAASGGDTGKWRQVLAAAGMDEAKWARVSEGWNGRMSGQGVSDPNATYELLAQYGKYFGQAGQGQYGAAAAANAGVAGTFGSAAGAVGPEPCTLERYGEIMGAQSAWSQQGRDVNAMLQKQFGMTALDFSNISQYWSAAMQKDYRIGLKMSEYQQQYEKRYLAAGGGGHDSDLTV